MNFIKPVFMNFFIVLKKGWFSFTSDGLDISGHFDFPVSFLFPIFYFIEKIKIKEQI